MRFTALHALFLSACVASAQKPAATSPAQGPRPQAAPEVAAAPEAGESGAAKDKTLRPARADEAAGSPYLGVLDRAGLVSIVEQGLGRVLARLKLSPVLTHGKFEGFRVNEIDPAWSASGVQVNDVLMRLNGQTIERPEQALAAFESLRVASEMALELVRGGEKLALRYRIE